MPRDSYDTDPSIIVIRHKGGTKDRLNMELALLPTDAAPSDASSSSASATTAAIATSDIIGGGSGGGGHPCFTGETMVGGKRIDEIGIGDDVPAFDAKRKTGLCKVTNTFVHEVLELLRVDLEDGTVLNVTPEHLFYDGEGFKPISELENGWVYDCSFKVLEVTNIYKVSFDKPVLVYNIETKWQTYFAGGIAVHNLKDPNDL